MVRMDDPGAHRKPIGGRAIVSNAVIDGDRLLMVRQGRGRDRNRWNLPGGKVDPGETLLDAAVRETLEETGYHTRIHGVAGLYDYTTATGKRRLRCVFLGHVIGGKPFANQREILEVRWIPLEEVFAMEPDALAKPHVLMRILNDLHRRTIDGQATMDRLAVG